MMTMMIIIMLLACGLPAYMCAENDEVESLLWKGRAS
jgi:hypothetical protein